MDDLFDQVKKELEENGEVETAPEAEKVVPEQGAQDLVDDISWDWSIDTIDHFVRQGCRDEDQNQDDLNNSHRASPVIHGKLKL